MWKKRSREKLRSALFPQAWKQVLRVCSPFYTGLPEQDRKEIEGHIQVFLAEKAFEGCAGLRITDETKLSIAVQACLLLLHRATNYFPCLQTILVYPTLFKSSVSRYVAYGVEEERSQVLRGQAWQDGMLLLAWDEVCRDAGSPQAGHNVVLHEFAHELDFEDGFCNGTPALGERRSRAERKQAYATWSRTMLSEFERLRMSVRQKETTVLRARGTSNPTEFFVVATEAFFCKPVDLHQDHPALYAELRKYYHQDPTQWPTDKRSARTTGSL